MNPKNNNNVRRKGRSIFLLTVLFRPRAVFEDLAKSEPSPYRVFFKFLVWFALLPPLFAYIGGGRSGWYLGAANPLVLSESELQLVSVLYFLVLIVAFVFVFAGMKNEPYRESPVVPRAKSDSSFSSFGSAW